MGLLDNLGASFGNMTNDPKQMGLLMAAAQMMAQSGPSARPVGIGEILGGGMNAYLGTKNGMQQQQAEQQEREQAQQYRGVQMQGMQQQQEAARAALVRAQELQDHFKRFRKGGQAHPMAASAQSQGLTMGYADGAEAPQMGAMPPMQGQPQPPQESPYQRHMAMAEHMRAGGYEDKAVEYENQALKFAPKVKNWQEVRVGNSVLMAPFFEDGTNGKPMPLEVARKLEFRSTGGKTLGLDSYTGSTVATYNNTATPDAVMADQRSRDFNANQQEANAIARGEKVATISTGLRKEFEDLPEVKGYKQALPAYSAIKDAVGRNTTQSDINIVYGLAKLYDPTSVVREGEYATVANSPNIPEKVKGYAQYLAGGGRLSDTVKKQILDEATSRMQTYETPFVAARQNYSQIAQRSGADSSLLFPTPHSSPVGQSGKFSVKAPNGKTYTFDSARDLANFKLSAGIR